jgi:hypothetical protein
MWNIDKATEVSRKNIDISLLLVKTWYFILYYLYTTARALRVRQAENLAMIDTYSSPSGAFWHYDFTEYTRGDLEQFSKGSMIEQSVLLHRSSLQYRMPHSCFSITL